MKARLFGVIILTIFLSACTAYRNDLNKANKAIAERTSDNNSSAGQALKYSLQHLLEAKTILDTATLENNKYTLSTNAYLTSGLKFDQGITGLQLSTDFVTRNRRLLGEGTPESIEIVDKMLSSNKIDQISGTLANNSNIKEESKIIQDKDEAIQKLIEYGAKYEKDRNDKILSYVKWGGGFLLIIGSIVGLMFIPGVLPLIIGAFPAVSSIFGVVGKSTVSAISKGIGETRYQLKERIKLIQETKEKNPTYEEDKWTTQEVLELIDTELSKSMSDKDKKMVEHIRNKINL